MNKQKRKRGKPRKQPCLCDGYWFPHRKGSLRCNYYTGQRDLEREWEEQMGNTFPPETAIPEEHTNGTIQEAAGEDTGHHPWFQ